MNLFSENIKFKQYIKLALSMFVLVWSRHLFNPNNIYSTFTLLHILLFSLNYFPQHIFTQFMILNTVKVPFATDFILHVNTVHC